MGKNSAAKKSAPKPVMSFRLSEEAKQMIEEIITWYADDGEKIKQVEIVEHGIRRFYNSTKRKRK